MRSVLLAAVAAAALAGRSSAERTIKIINECSYDIWPVAIPFAENKEAYNGDRGWEAKAGSTKSITVPSSWIGRIWARHGCVANSDGTLACVGNALQCADGELGGGATAVELRLQYNQQGQYDGYDLTNGGGWGVPIGLKPQGSGCDYVSCTPTLSSCPDDQLKLQDSYGNVLGCNSACYAKMGDSNVQCCKGDYNNPDSCTPDLIQFYSYFKEACPNAYAYFQDARAGQPTVSYICKSEDDPGFTVTFCPDGDGDSAGSFSNPSGGTSGSASGSGEKSAGGPTATGATTVPTDLPAVTSAASVNVSEALTAASSGAKSSAGASSSGGSAAGSSTSSASSPSSSSGSSSTDSADSESAEDSSSSSSSSSSLIPGLSNTMLAVIVGGIALLLCVGVGVACVVMRKKDRATSQQQQQGQAAGGHSNSDEEAAAGAPTGGAAGSGKNPAAGQNYNALGHGRRRSQAALLSSSEEESGSSELSDPEEEKYGHHRRASMASTASRRSGTSQRSARSSRR
ncbi:hypothetical protein JCM10449v2_000555 [Rhodotorula kratochvilovae]